MKLYKYIGFHVVNKSTKPVWDEPLLDGKLYFSPIHQLRGVNDKNEFDHKWEHTSYFFNEKVSKEFIPRYRRIFDNACTLCMSRVLSETCWKRFIPTGGICYEFDYDESGKNSDVSAKRVVYDNTKVCNFPEFVIMKVKSARIRELLSKESAFSPSEAREISLWLDSGEPNQIGYDHIFEMTWKKTLEYSAEYEFRFIHPKEPMDNKTTRLINSKLDFAALGLHLSRIHTSDIERVKAKSQNTSLAISGPSFLTKAIF